MLYTTLLNSGFTQRLGHPHLYTQIDQVLQDGQVNLKNYYYEIGAQTKCDYDSYSNKNFPILEDPILLGIHCYRNCILHATRTISIDPRANIQLSGTLLAYDEIETYPYNIIVGLLTFKIKNNELHIDVLSVLESYQKHKVGRHLLCSVVQIAHHNKLNKITLYSIGNSLTYFSHYFPREKGGFYLPNSLFEPFIESIIKNNHILRLPFLEGYFSPSLTNYISSPGKNIRFMRILFKIQMKILNEKHTPSQKLNNLNEYLDNKSFFLDENERLLLIETRNALSYYFTKILGLYDQTENMILNSNQDKNITLFSENKTKTTYFSKKYFTLFNNIKSNNCLNDSIEATHELTKIDKIKMIKTFFTRTLIEHDNALKTHSIDIQEKQSLDIQLRKDTLNQVVKLI